MLNQHLIKLARHSVSMNLRKEAFQPPGGGAPPMDPSAGGAPMDPSMMGGQPPMDPSMGGAPPMDPSMAGGAPPMDPSMGGGAPPPDPAAGGPMPGGGGMTSDTIRQVMQEVLGQLGMVPGQSGPGGGAAGGKPGKPDLLAMSMDIFQIKKILTTIMNAMDIPMPQDILDGPNRDPATGAPMPPNAPGSTSDPNKPSPPAGGAGGAGGAPAPASSIKGIGPMPGAFPGGGAGAGGGGQQKSGRDLRSKAAALNAVLRRSKSRV